MLKFSLTLPIYSSILRCKKRITFRMGIEPMKTFQLIIGIGQDKDGNDIGESALVAIAMKKLEHKLASSFGGFTRVNSVGGWLVGDEIITETGLVYTIGVDAVAACVPLAVIASEYAKLAAELFNQQSVAYIVDNSMCFSKN